MVPTTPELPLSRRNDGVAEAVSSLQVPSSDRFGFGSDQDSSGLNVILASPNSGLHGEEGLDRTALDIQLSPGGEVRMCSRRRWRNEMVLRTVRRVE